MTAAHKSLLFFKSSILFGNVPGTLRSFRKVKELGQTASLSHCSRQNSSPHTHTESSNVCQTFMNVSPKLVQWLNPWFFFYCMYGCFVVGLVLSVLPPDSAHFDEIEKEFQFILPVCIFCFVSSSNFTMYLDCNLEDDQDKLVCVCACFLREGGFGFHSA